MRYTAFVSSPGSIPLRKEMPGSCGIINLSTYIETGMKKTLFVLLALYGVSLATAESTGSGSSPSVFGKNSDFTVTYEWNQGLSGVSADLSFGFGPGSDSGSGSKVLALPIINGQYTVIDWSNFTYETKDLTGDTIQLKVSNGQAEYFNGNDKLCEIDLGNTATCPKAITVKHGGATVTLGEGAVELDSLNTYDSGTIVTPGNLTISGLVRQGNNYQPNKVDNLEVKGSLTLGTADSASALKASGTIKVAGGITLGNAASSITAAALDCNSLNLTMADSELQKLTSGSTTVITLGSAYNGSTTLNGTNGEYICGEKMTFSLKWESASTSGNDSWVLNLYANPNSSYVQNKLSGITRTYNGRAGLAILSDAFVTLNPQVTSPNGDLAGLMNTVDAGAASQNIMVKMKTAVNSGAMTDAALAAAAGASVTVLGQAFSGDVDRQLRAIRNRSISGASGNDAVVLDVDGKGGLAAKPQPSRYFAWANAEGNRAEQDADGTAAGYTLSSWGVTLGAGMQVNNRLTLGLALTAMYGDLQSDGPDSLDGDMDTAYLSAFAQYKKGVWNHSFIGTVGGMESDYSRSVAHATGSYSTAGDMEGASVGLMYELSREYALTGKSSISPVLNISYRHTEVDAYTERNSDAALSVGKQSLDTATVGVGARYEAVVGQRMLNHSCDFEARALAKCDLGDRQSETMVGFVGQGVRVNIESAEMGAFGMEMGAGISMPAGRGSVFADGAVELRSDYTNFNATVGYKIQF